MSARDRAIQVGEILEGRYRIVSEGTPQDFGAIYRAYDMQHDRLVEAMVLTPRFGQDEGVLNQIIQANKAIADLQQPGLVPAEHVGQVRGQPFLVRGQAAGRPLAELLARVGSLKMDVAVEIIIRLCEELAPLHRAGLVHGGLSPYSVLVSVNDQASGKFSRTVAVIDAGLIPALRPLFALPGQPWGRFPYLSPEQSVGKNVHAASDVYVIGSLLYEMLTGRPPFRASDERVLALQHLRQEPPSLPILVPKIPLALAQIVQKALAKEPAARYRNAGQVAYILRSQVGTQLARQAPQPPPPRAAPVEERLVVPPPPPPAPSPMVGQARVIYDAGSETDDWDQEAGVIDWILIGLIIAALVAVLGLIPLWRTVYRRYAVPPPVAPASRDLHNLESPTAWTRPELDQCEVRAAEELDDLRLVWYNSTISGILRERLSQESLGMLKQREPPIVDLRAGPAHQDDESTSLGV